jgi:hypothetical protein
MIHPHKDAKSLAVLVCYCAAVVCSSVSQFAVQCQLLPPHIWMQQPHWHTALPAKNKQNPEIAILQYCIQRIAFSAHALTLCNEG